MRHNLAINMQMKIESVWVQSYVVFSASKLQSYAQMISERKMPEKKNVSFGKQNRKFVRLEEKNNIFEVLRNIIFILERE